MSRRCARRSEKTSEARIAESVRELGDRREELLAAAGVRAYRLDPKTYRYASRRSGDVEIRYRLKALAGQRRRFGYGRLHTLLRREGTVLNHKKLLRLYREERQTVRGAAGASARSGHGRR